MQIKKILAVQTQWGGVAYWEGNLTSGQIIKKTTSKKLSKVRKTHIRGCCRCRWLRSCLRAFWSWSRWGGGRAGDLELFSTLYIRRIQESGYLHPSHHDVITLLIIIVILTWYLLLLDLAPVIMNHHRHLSSSYVIIITITSDHGRDQNKVSASIFIHLLLRIQHETLYDAVSAHVVSWKKLCPNVVANVVCDIIFPV